ncbi:LLM class flavin-dependent oxidoreductase [Hamadaea tsunoensis]|uniref:LLM class flavin-dependent oxidoreductase n=1 Tax=Hamadaea tsunoensis TaxID=53368 RepID=UPI00040F299E|nr:LLM class flavin-dependent oxidoreductase [Hamadaea tsunoensis]
MKLSVLDLMTVRTGQSTADALAASLALAGTADRLGYHRYWVAEHHNMPSVGSTSPPVLIALIAAHTQRIRIGSGGVMLPNHQPLIVAEQFALLEAYAPGRIDLGLGRAPGSDPVVSAVLGRARDAGVEDFPGNVQAIAAFLAAEGAKVRLADDSAYDLRATPAAASVPDIWLLGSSDYSARLAASLGLPYVFASHFFGGQGTERALDLYRDNFRPSELLAAPRVFVTANAVVADTDEEARALALPHLQRIAFMRSGRPMEPMATVEEAAATALTPLEQQLIADLTAGPAWFIGEPGPVARGLRAYADGLGADEVMISPTGSASADEDPRRYPAREHTLELLATELF